MEIKNALQCNTPLICNILYIFKLFVTVLKKNIFLNCEDLLLLLINCEYMWILDCWPDKTGNLMASNWASVSCDDHFSIFQHLIDGQFIK